MCCHAMCQCEDAQTLPDSCITGKAADLRAWLPSRYNIICHADWRRAA